MIDLFWNSLDTAIELYRPTSAQIFVHFYVDTPNIKSTVNFHLNKGGRSGYIKWTRQKYRKHSRKTIWRFKSVQKGSKTNQI